MKKIILSAFLMFGLTMAVQAQYALTPGASSAPFAYTNLAQAATNVGAWIDCRGSQFVSLWINSTNDTSATDNIGYVFYRAMDSTLTNSIEDGAVANIILAQTGLTGKTVITNIPTFGCGFLYFKYSTNAAATGNAVVRWRYALKKGI